MYSICNVAESLCVSSPKYNHFIDIIVFFKIFDVFSDLFHMLKFIVTWEDIVGSVFLVNSNEIWIIYSFHWFDIFHVGV